MAMTTRRAGAGARVAWDFLVRRVVRVVPIYWIFTALKLLIVLAIPVASLKAMPTVTHVAASFFFVPHQTPSGEFWPVLPVGWTLNFEMFFYAVFAIVIAAGVQKILGVAVIFGAIALVAQLHLAPSFLNFYVDSLLIEFALGMCLAALVSSQAWKAVAGAKKVLVGLALCVAAILFLMLEGTIPRGLTWGGAAACIVCLTLLLEQNVRDCQKLRPLVKAGDSSYSLYLIHTFTVPAAVLLAGKVVDSNPVVAVSFAVIVSVVAAEIGYRVLERPLLRAVSRRLPRG